MVKVSADNGNGEPGTVIAEYRYDGRGWRIAKLLPNGENWDRTDFYYNVAWQCLEERYGANQAKETVPTSAKIQWLWSVQYIDAPVVRWRDGNCDGDLTGGTGEGDNTLYYTNDANMNVTALVDASDGAVVERYSYDPYGKATVRHGVRDAAGNDTSASEWSARTSNTFSNEILYCGYRYDPETGLYSVRFRIYDPVLGRWITWDPMGGVDGPDLYQYCRGIPLVFSDPWGLAATAKGTNTVVVEVEEVIKQGQIHLPGLPATITLAHWEMPIDWEVNCDQNVARSYYDAKRYNITMAHDPVLIEYPGTVTIKTNDFGAAKKYDDSFLTGKGLEPTMIAGFQKLLGIVGIVPVPIGPAEIAKEGAKGFPQLEVVPGLIKTGQNENVKKDPANPTYAWSWSGELWIDKTPLVFNVTQNVEGVPVTKSAQSVGQAVKSRAKLELKLWGVCSCNYSRTLQKKPGPFGIPLTDLKVSPSEARIEHEFNALPAGEGYGWHVYWK